MEEEWRVIILVFSGRPDPQWQLSADEVRRFIALWEKAAVAAKESQIPPTLGYRGIKLLQGKKQWIIYNGVVTCEEAGVIQITRKDDDKNMERFLLSTAPVPTQSLLRQLNLMN